MERLAVEGAEQWPEGVSDGLSLPCVLCDRVPRFDYRVEDEFWRDVVPDPLRQEVMCLPCLDRTAEVRDMDVSEALIEVQFTGVGKTVVLRPDRVVTYDREPVYVHSSKSLYPATHVLKTGRETLCGRQVASGWRPGKNGDLCKHCEKRLPTPDDHGRESSE